MKLALRRAIKAPHLRVSPVLRGGRGLKLIAMVAQDAYRRIARP